MAEPHLDHPDELHWFKGHGPAPVLGPCPHTRCKHLGQGVIAHGPSYERYELVACGSIRPADESASDCAMHCRAWVDERGRTVTPWLRIDLSAEQPPRSPHEVDQPIPTLDAVLAAPVDPAVRLPEVSAAAVPVSRCGEHGKVLPHYRCEESERWLDGLAARTTETHPPAADRG